jgi:para-aminobenzoate synthetase component I
MTTRESNDLPLVVELRPPPDVESALISLSALPHSLLLDSALREPRLGRYSFLTADPFEFFTVPADGIDALALLETKLQSWQQAARPDLPPFQGGAAGLLSYDIGHSLERIPAPRSDAFQIPVLAIGLYDTVLAIDHAEHRAWLISQGFPETEPSKRLVRAKKRLEQFQEWLQKAPRCGVCQSPAVAIAASELAPRFSVAGPAGLASNFSASDYQAMVRRAIEYIHAGCIRLTAIRSRFICGCGSAIRLRSLVGSILAKRKLSVPRRSDFCACTTGLSRRGQSRARGDGQLGLKRICSRVTIYSKVKKIGRRM